MSDQSLRAKVAKPAQTVTLLRNVWREAAGDGSPMPGEQTLAEMLGVSRPSIREALTRLEAEGLIHRRHGAQAAVNAAALEIDGRFDLQFNFPQTLGMAGIEVEQELLRAERFRLSDTEAERLAQPSGTEAMRLVKRWRADGVPALAAIDVFPLIRPAEQIDLNLSVFTIMSQILGEEVTWEVSFPSAVNASPDVAQWLELDEGDAVLTLECLGVTVSGLRAYTAQQFFRPGALRLGMVRSVHI